jgi:nitrogen regulatory protein PII
MALGKRDHANTKALSHKDFGDSRVMVFPIEDLVSVNKGGRLGGAPRYDLK